MDFLKEVLGEELYNQFTEKVNAFNADEANKDKQIKLANLALGQYVSKDKYGALETSLGGKQSELDAANKLIGELKQATKNDEDTQTKISGYETQVADLQKQLEDIKVKSAIKVALLSEKATDVDYLTFKLESKLKDENRSLQLDDNGNIKGWNDMLTGLKTQFPTQFENSASKKVDENKLPDSEERETEPTSLAEALKQTYEKK